MNNPTTFKTAIAAVDKAGGGQFVCRKGSSHRALQTLIELDMPPRGRAVSRPPNLRSVGLPIRTFVQDPSQASDV